VLSFVREFGDDVVLCVNNLSRFPQPVELDLRRFEGYTPVELTGRVEFPQIGVLPYMLTLAGRSKTFSGRHMKVRMRVSKRGTQAVRITTKPALTKRLSVTLRAKEARR